MNPIMPDIINDVNFLSSCGMNDFVITLTNGQWMFRRVGFQKPEIDELYVKGIHAALPRRELYQILSSAGPIYNLRVSVHYGGRNRGYAFVTYFQELGRETALRSISGRVVGGKRILIENSINNRTLYISGIPLGILAEDAKRQIESQLSSYNCAVNLPPKWNSLWKHFGIAYVDFQNHAPAALAKRSDIFVNDKRLSIDWANIRPTSDNARQLNVKVLVISHLLWYDKADEIVKFFEGLVKNTPFRVTNDRRIRHKVYVEFENHADATIALKRAERTQFKGRKMYIKWAINSNTLRLMYHDAIGGYKSKPARW